MMGYDNFGTGIYMLIFIAEAGDDVKVEKKQINTLYGYI